MDTIKELKEFNPNDIPRCDSCNFDTFIWHKYEGGFPIISYECQNKNQNKLKLT